MRSYILMLSPLLPSSQVGDVMLENLLLWYNRGAAIVDYIAIDIK